jgi:predicted RNA-binding Zn ribbon-like protein
MSRRLAASSSPQAEDHRTVGRVKTGSPGTGRRTVLFRASAQVTQVLGTHSLGAAGELARLRFCAAGDCDNVLVDLSKNRSRRFCGLTCANRVNVAAYAPAAAPHDRFSGA